MITGHADELAYYDGVRGLVPCYVLAVTERAVRVEVYWGGCLHPLQLGESPYGDVTTTEEFAHRHVVPEKAISTPRRRDSYTTWIESYCWEASTRRAPKRVRLRFRALQLGMDQKESLGVTTKDLEAFVEEAESELQYRQSEDHRGEPGDPMEQWRK